MDTLVCNRGADAATEYCGGLADLAEWYGWATFLAGILILVLAPVLGQRADVAGNKKRWVVGATAVLALIQFALFFAFADPAFFWFGAVAIALGAVTSEIAGVNYNAMLVEVSTPRTVGRVSGLGLGARLHRRHPRARAGRACSTRCEWFGLDTSDGLAYRLIAVGCAVWTVVFAIPFVLNVPEAKARTDREKIGFFASYGRLVRDIARTLPQPPPDVLVPHRERRVPRWARRRLRLRRSPRRRRVRLQRRPRSSSSASP